MDAGCDDTRARRKQFGVFLCLPMALVLLLICNGDFGMSPIYGHHGARRYLPVSVHVGRRTLTAMGVEKLICPMSALGQKQTFDTAERHVRFTPESGHVQRTSRMSA